MDRTQVLIGGRWYDFEFYLDRIGSCVRWVKVRTKEYPDRFGAHLYKGPEIWVSRRSTSDREVVPQICQRVTKLFGSRVLVVLTDALIDSVEAAFDEASPHPGYRQAQAEDVLAFLRQHKGKRAWLY